MLARPADWKANASLTGFCFHEPRSADGTIEPTTPYSPDRELSAFLESGPAPFYAGFGSMISRDPDAFARLARHRDRLCVAICPRTTRAISGVLPPVALLRGAGIRVCLGTDGRGSNPDLSILAECRALVDAGLTSPAEALRMATVTGAWALGCERRAGMLAPGRPADLVVLRPAQAIRDPYEAALDPSATIVATLRSGHLIHGALTG